MLSDFVLSFVLAAFTVVASSVAFVFVSACDFEAATDAVEACVIFDFAFAFAVSLSVSLPAFEVDVLVEVLWLEVAPYISSRLTSTLLQASSRLVSNSL